MSAPILDQVLSSSKLPSLSTVAIKLLELTRDPEVELDDIADLVQYDQALAGKILETVNSSYYSLAQPCPTIKRALVYLGLSTVKSLVLGFSLVDLTKDCSGSFDLLDYWRRCVYSAAAARRIAMVTDSCNPDEAFIAALMQDVGMLAMHSVLGSQYDDVVSQAKGNHLMLPYCETETLGCNHAEAGAELGERWHLPDQLIDPIRRHHQRSTPFGRHHAVINSVILGYRISSLITAPDHRHVLDMISAMSQIMFHMSPEDEREIMLLAREDAQELSVLLEVQIGQLPDIEALLAEADATLHEHQAELQRQTEELRRTWEAGPIKKTPPAEVGTGLGNRSQFDEELARRFESAKRQREGLGLILLDADRFNTVNDNFGRQIGDLVLKAMANRLRGAVSNAGMVYRSGGQAFAVVMPGATKIDTTRMAERLRKAIEGEPVDLRGAADGADSVTVTASLGVTALEPETSDQWKQAHTLYRAADQALYAAKTAGRNCVRVFSPKSSADAA